jgi:hypothetical protein
MRFISTRFHGVLDYLVGILLIAAPWLFDFAQGGAETWVPVIFGAGALLYSMFTNYELGLVRRLSMRTHLSLDAASGVLLAASPWILGFSEVVFWPHLILGLFEVVAALTTRMTPSYTSS